MNTKKNRRTDATPEVVTVLLGAHREFLSFLEKRTVSRDDAEDILQDAFSKALEKAEDLRRAESARAWFYRLLRRALIDQHRADGARERAMDRFAAIAESDSELDSAICRCIERVLPNLPEEQATLLRRIELEGVSLREQARSLGLAPNAASARLRRARRALFREIQWSCRTCAVHGCLDCHC